MPNHVSPGAVIYAKDVRKLSLFYEQVTQLTRTLVDNTYTILESSQFQLVIHAIPAHIADSFEIRIPPDRRKDTAIKLMLTVASIHNARESAATLGGQVDATDHEWQFQNCLICDGHDPEGNVFQLREFLAETV
ncbi:VOC family protein [Undibacterium sp. TJN19]|uniref:VOC family protein n=1 Tax=Undibacterium sp. TJN19 TaxID=3413055 RepID=UPI003BF127E5